MARINKLVMEGFKSFQRKTAVPFFPGLTAIVGENGAGKTNILDALFFVMGNRSSNLRAEKMDHLIFNGGKGRKPADFAMVTLHIDNKDHSFDDFLGGAHSDEITIARKVTRASSTYKFQGKNCQRSIVDQILSKLDLDSLESSFIKQNEITRIVKKNSVERRKFIDEISGISAFEEKKQQSLKELEKVESSLLEKEIVLTERKTLLEKLERERKAAVKYKELDDLKNKLEFAILKLRQNVLTAQLEKNQEKIKNLKIKETELSSELEDVDSNLDSAESDLDNLDEGIEKNRELSVFREIEHLKNEIFKRQSEISSKLNEIKTLEQSVEEINKIRSSYQGFGANHAAKTILDLGWPGIHGTLRDLLKVPERYSIAVETAAAGHMSDIVVDSRDLSIKCINYLKQNNLGRARILPLEKLHTRPKSDRAEKALQLPGVIDFAINLVNFDAKFGKAVKYVLQDTLVSENLEAVKTIEGVRVVTLDGDSLSAGGAMVGGSKLKTKTQKTGPDASDKVACVEKLKNEILDLKREVGDLNKLLDEKRSLEEKESSSSKSMIEKRKNITKKLDDLRKDREKNYSELSQAKMELNKLEGTNEHFRGELEEIATELNDVSHFKDEEITEFMDSTVETLKYKRTSALKKLNGLGIVNLKAIGEYEDYKKDYDGFKDKVEKIRIEKEEIEHLISEVEDKKKEKFMIAFKKLSDDFDKIFKDLFGGGEAQLELEDPENIESGLIIRAHPPHKKPHVIDSLSGGEQSLTAIAFIFAIQEQKKSPFYILDEIDAALDASNSKKVAELLKKYADALQLIMVSHNQETVRYADRVYGVSMESGVSKIRSVDLSTITDSNGNNN